MMGACCCRSTRRTDTKPLLSDLSPSRKQQWAMKRAITLEGPQRTLEINIDDMHSHNSLPLSLNKQRLAQSLQNQSFNQPQQQNLITKPLDTDHDKQITFCPSPSFETNTQQLSTENIIDSNQLKRFCKELYGKNCSTQNIKLISANKDFETIHAKHYNCDYSHIHPFINCLQIAYFNRYPLIIKPSHIWLLILQRICTHSGRGTNKTTLIETQFDIDIGVDIDIETEIENNILGDAKLFSQNDYSTSTKLEDVALKVCVMNVCQLQGKQTQILNGTMANGHNSRGVEVEENKEDISDIKHKKNGFVSIKLVATKQDWIKLKTKTIHLLKSDKIEREFCNKWSVALLPILDKFINVYDGEIDKVFWNNMIQRHDDDNYYNNNGWINVLCPFDAFGIGLCSVTINLDHNINDFLSGFIGITQHKKTLEIEPIIGWFIVQKNIK